jgi:hypothetical protein
MHLKTRDLLILSGLVILILGLTIAEKFAERRREQRREANMAVERALWQQRMNNALDARWQELSSQLRKTLDSMASDVVAGGVSRDSLAAIVLDSTFPGSPSLPGASVTARRLATSDTLPVAVLREYDRGLLALPSDLSAYERRIAINEVAGMVRARFGLSSGQFDSLLKHVRSGT